MKSGATTPEPTRLHRRHRGWRWSLARVVFAISGSLVLGSFLGVLSAAGIMVGEGRERLGLMNDLDVFFVGGGVLGGLSFPILLGVATSRRALEGVLLVSAATGVAAFGSGVLAVALDNSFIILPVTLGVYILSCLGWHGMHGSDAWVEVRGVCWKCAYDLAGSPSDLCPECGATNVPTEGEHS